MKRVIDCKFNSIFRCMDMLCLNIGKDIKNKDGKIFPEFSFHIQTQWRFVRNGEILLASRDIYIPYNQELDESGWEYDIIGRPDDESSIFDVVKKKFDKLFSDSVVKEIDVSPLGDLKINFSNGIYFETFTPSMRKDEFWRFFTAYDEEHIIVFDV